MLINDHQVEQQHRKHMRDGFVATREKLVTFERRRQMHESSHLTAYLHTQDCARRIVRSRLHEFQYCLQLSHVRIFVCLRMFDYSKAVRDKTQLPIWELLLSFVSMLKVLVNFPFIRYQTYISNGWNMDWACSSDELDLKMLTLVTDIQTFLEEKSITFHKTYVSP